MFGWFKNKSEKEDDFDTDAVVERGKELDILCKNDMRCEAALVAMNGMLVGKVEVNVKKIADKAVLQANALLVALEEYEKVPTS